MTSLAGISDAITDTLKYGVFRKSYKYIFDIMCKVAGKWVWEFQ